MFNIALFGAGRIGQVHAVNIAGHKETKLTLLSTLPTQCGCLG